MNNGFRAGLHSLTVLLGFPLLAAAEPTSTVHYLMQRPVSVFDFGMFRLEKLLSGTDWGVKSLPGSKVSVSADASYDWDANRIRINLMVMPGPSPVSASAARAACREVIGHSRAYLGVYPETGERIPDIVRLSTYFVSDSFTLKDQPKNLDTELDSMIEFTAWVYSSPQPDGSYKPLVRCEGRLLSKDVMFPN